MLSFETFINKKEVMPVKKDENMALSLVEDAKQRFSYFSKQEIKEENIKFIFESYYESIRELLDAIMIKEGYKSYSHQAPIVYAKDKKIISEKDAIILDSLRQKRNKSKYYGKTFDYDYLIEKIIFLKDKFKEIMKELK